jgi:hypothetical protein
MSHLLDESEKHEEQAAAQRVEYYQCILSKTKGKPGSVLDVGFRIHSFPDALLPSLRNIKRCEPR